MQESQMEEDEESDDEEEEEDSDHDRIMNGLFLILQHRMWTKW